jgi:hypothetical protein
VISYKITSKSLSKSECKAHKRKKIKTNDPDYKERVLERILLRLSFRKGERVRIVNTRTCRVISKIRYDVNDVNWVDDKPHFIEIVLDEDGSTFLACPYQLTKKRT